MSKEAAPCITNFFKADPPTKRIKLLSRPSFVPVMPETSSAHKVSSPEPDSSFVERLATEHNMQIQQTAELVKATWRFANLPLSTKYEPVRLIEAIQSLDARPIKSYLRAFSNRTQVMNLDDMPQALIVKGPSGSGKTSLVRAACKDLQLKLIELNASCIRSGAALQRIIGESTQTYSVLRKQTPTAVLLDDVDIILDADKGFFKTLLEIVSQTKSPIVLTCSKS